MRTTSATAEARALQDLERAIADSALPLMSAELRLGLASLYEVLGFLSVEELQGSVEKSLRDKIASKELAADAKEVQAAMLAMLGELMDRAERAQVELLDRTQREAASLDLALGGESPADGNAFSEEVLQRAAKKLRDLSTAIKAREDWDTMEEVDQFTKQLEELWAAVKRIAAAIACEKGQTAAQRDAYLFKWRQVYVEHKACLEECRDALEEEAWLERVSNLVRKGRMLEARAKELPAELDELAGLSIELDRAAAEIAAALTDAESPVDQMRLKAAKLSVQGAVARVARARARAGLSVRQESSSGRSGSSGSSETGDHQVAGASGGLEMGGMLVVLMKMMVETMKSISSKQDNKGLAIPSWPKFNDNEVAYFSFKRQLLAHIKDFYAGISQESLVAQIKNQCLTLATRDLVGHCDSVSEILRCLDQWFDRPFKFVESSMEMFRKMENLQEKDMHSHFKHYSRISGLIKEAELRGQSACLLTASNMEVMLEHCSHEERRHWWEISCGRGGPTAEQFTMFVNRRKEVACFEMGRLAKPFHAAREERPASRKVEGKEPETKKPEPRFKKQEQPAKNEVVAAAADGARAAKRGGPVTCYFTGCGEAHPCRECPLFLQASQGVKLQMLWDARICQICLSHRSASSGENCFRKRPCGVRGCPDLHHPLLHMDRRPPKEAGQVCQSQEEDVEDDGDEDEEEVRLPDWYGGSGVAMAVMCQAENKMEKGSVEVKKADNRNSEVKKKECRRPRSKKQELPTKRKVVAAVADGNGAAAKRARTISCYLLECGGAHPCRECPKFLRADHGSRIQMLWDAKVCQICLSHRSMSNGENCFRKRTCGVMGCQDLHHPLLHLEKTDVKKVGQVCHAQKEEVLALDGGADVAVLGKRATGGEDMSAHEEGAELVETVITANLRREVAAAPGEEAALAEDDHMKIEELTRRSDSSSAAWEEVVDLDGGAVHEEGSEVPGGRGVTEQLKRTDSNSPVSGQVEHLLNLKAMLDGVPQGDLPASLACNKPGEDQDDKEVELPDWHGGSKVKSAVVDIKDDHEDSDDNYEDDEEECRLPDWYGSHGTKMAILSVAEEFEEDMEEGFVEDDNDDHEDDEDERRLPDWYGSHSTGMAVDEMVRN